MTIVLEFRIKARCYPLSQEEICNIYINLCFMDASDSNMMFFYSTKLVAPQVSAHFHMLLPLTTPYPHLQ